MTSRLRVHGVTEPLLYVQVTVRVNVHAMESR